MDTSTYIVLFLLIFIIIWTERRKKCVVYKQLRNRSQEGKQMETMARNMIGKRCAVELFGGNVYKGVIEQVADKAILLQQKKDTRIVNLEFVVSITQLPEKK